MNNVHNSRLYSYRNSPRIVPKEKILLVRDWWILSVMAVLFVSVLLFETSVALKKQPDFDNWKQFGPAHVYCTEQNIAGSIRAPGVEECIPYRWPGEQRRQEKRAAFCKTHVKLCREDF